MATLATVARRGLRAPDSAEELVRAVEALRDTALRAPDLHRMVLGLNGSTERAMRIVRRAEDRAKTARARGLGPPLEA